MLLDSSVFENNNLLIGGKHHAFMYIVFPGKTLGFLCEMPNLEVQFQLYTWQVDIYIYNYIYTVYIYIYIIPTYHGHTLK